MKCLNFLGLFKMAIEDLGYNIYFDNYRKERNLISFEIGRIIIEHKERYIVKNDSGEFESEITGNLRFSAKSRSDFPAVGDWVAFLKYDDLGIIHHILPRKTILERQAIGKFGEKQIIAVNIDFAIIMQAVDRDFNINRIERYLTICHSAKVEPLIVLSKIDLIQEHELEYLINEIRTRIEIIPVIPVSNQTGIGYDKIKSALQKGKTYCILGSSGVGKSTMLNNLIGKEVMETSSISISTNKGRHITSHRELIVLESGGILIDTPGMREIGIADSSNGIEITFDIIEKLSRECKFSDCTHIHEKGCAVIAAVEEGSLHKSTYTNYLKMERERIHFQSSMLEKRQKDKKFGKMVKEVMKIKKLNKR
jgi:ribosome biogenesis GTPase / thiamine phosphate phosphatase